MKELKEKNKKLVICSIVMITLILLFAGYEMATVFWKVDSGEEQEEKTAEQRLQPSCGGGRAAA